MQIYKWTIYALFASLIVASSGCQKNVLQQWPLISGFWPGEDEELPAASGFEDDMQYFPASASTPLPSIRQTEHEDLEKNYSESETLYRQMLVKNPNDPEAHHRLAILADNQKDFESSEHHYKKSLEKLPGSPDLLNDFGYSLFLQKRFKESKDYLQQALDVDPKNRRSLTNLALVQGTMGEIAAAMETLLKIHSQTTANRIMNQLFPEKSLTRTTGSNTENTPTVSIEGIQPLPMSDRTLKMPLTANPEGASSETLARGSSRSPLIQIPISRSSSFQPGELLNDAANNFGNPGIPGAANKNIQQTSFRDTFPSRKFGRAAFSNGRDSRPFDEEANSAESELLNFYYRKALILGHNVGHEGFLFPVFENTTGK